MHIFTYLAHPPNLYRQQQTKKQVKGAEPDGGDTQYKLLF